jgi:hypothetical protein
MVSAVRLTGLKWDDGAVAAITIADGVPGARIDDRDPRFRTLPENAGYPDCYAVLSKDEAMAIVKSGEWLVETWMKADPGSSARSRYEAMLVAIEESNLVVAQNYEWESGLVD